MLTAWQVLRCALNAGTTGFYLLFLATIVKYRQKKPFSDSFFKLCLSIGVTDLLTIMHAYATMRVPNYGIMHNIYMRHDTGWLPTLALGGHWYFVFTQHWGVFLIALNRLTGVCLPVRHKSIWARALKPAILLQYIIPLLQATPLFVFGSFRYVYELCESDQSSCVNATAGYLRPRELDNTYLHPLRVRFEDMAHTRFLMEATALFSLTINTMSLMMYVVMFKTLQQHQNKVAPANTNRSSLAAERRKRQEHDLEVRLVMAAFVISGVLFAYLVWMCLLIVSISVKSAPFRPFDLIILHHLVTDALANANPFILYAMCEAVRKGIKDLLMSFVNRT